MATAQSQAELARAGEATSMKIEARVAEELFLISLAAHTAEM